MNDSVLERVLLSLNFTPSDIEYICPIDASEEYKRFILMLNVYIKGFVWPSVEDIAPYIQQIDYFFTLLTETHKIDFAPFRLPTSKDNIVLLVFLLEETSLPYSLLKSWSKRSVHRCFVYDIFKIVDHHFHKHLCRFLLENPVDEECQNLAKILAKFASIDTFRIIYEAKELDLNGCLYWAAISNNLPIVQLLLRDPCLKLDQSMIDLLKQLIMNGSYESFILIFEACETTLTKEDISRLLNEALLNEELRKKDDPLNKSTLDEDILRYVEKKSRELEEVLNLLKRHPNYSDEK